MFYKAIKSLMSHKLAVKVSCDSFSRHWFSTYTRGEWTEWCMTVWIKFPPQSREHLYTDFEDISYIFFLFILLFLLDKMWW